MNTTRNEESIPTDLISNNELRIYMNIKKNVHIDLKKPTYLMHKYIKPFGTSYSCSENSPILGELQKLMNTGNMKETEIKKVKFY